MMAMRYFAVILLALFLGGCSSTPLSRTVATRTVAISPNVTTVPYPPGSAAIQTAIDEVLATGVNGGFLQVYWGGPLQPTLEPSQGQYAIDFTQWLVSYHRTHGARMYLQLATIHSYDQRPADLQALPWDSPVVITRFHALLDHLQPTLAMLDWVVIGNEVDTYFSQHPEQLAGYQNFYNDAVAYIHRIAPEVKVGVCITSSGLSRPEMKLLSANSDIAATTYYPATPAAPDTDFPTLLNAVYPKPLIFQEIGFASVPNGLFGSAGSESLQAQFVDNVYAAWSKYADVGGTIPYLDFFELHDEGPDSCQAALQYGGGNPLDPAWTWMCHIGLRNADDTPKIGWDRFVVGVQSVK